MVEDSAEQAENGPDMFARVCEAKGLNLVNHLRVDRQGDSMRNSSVSSYRTPCNCRKLKIQPNLVWYMYI